MLEKYLTKVDFDSYEDMKKNMQVKVPENFNFAYDVLDEWAKNDPDRKAVVWCNPEGEEKTLTFKEISVLSDKFANVLKERGIKKGDIVALILKRRWEFWVSIMACHKIGAVVIPVNHLMKKKDFVYRFTAVNVKGVVCVNEKATIDEIEMAFPECPQIHTRILVGNEDREGWINWQKSVDGASYNWARPTGEEATSNRDILLMYYTSGTTGMPKIVALDQTYPLGHIVTAKYWLNCEDKGLHLTVSDTGWAKSVWGKLYGQWICGSAVFVYDYDRFIADELLSLIEKYKINTFCAPPTIYRFFIKEDLSKYDFSNLHYACTAGEALHPEVFNVFEKATGKKIYEAYGQTEAVVLLGSFIGVEPKPGSMGVPSPLFDIDIIDDDFKPVDEGNEGHLVVKWADENRPVGLFNGYIFDEALTKEKIQNGYYFTGDMAWKDEDGYYWFVGRSDDLIKTSGYRVGPFEVESVLMEHPSVLECAITGVPDPVRGQVVKATIVLAKGFSPSDELAEELREYVRINTAPYKYPRIIEFVEELPKTISGKIRRVEIRDKSK